MLTLLATLWALTASAQTPTPTSAANGPGLANDPTLGIPGDPVFETDLIDLKGSISYRTVNGSDIVGKNQIVIALEPFRGLLPTKVVIDLEKGVLNQAEIEFIRIMVGAFQFGFPAYKRNIEGGVTNEARVVSVKLPIYVKDFGKNTDPESTEENALQGTVNVTLGSNVGYRWFLDGNWDGAYFEPTLAVQMTAALLDRVFMSASANYSFSIMPGIAPNYKDFGGQMRLMVGLNEDSSIRLGAFAGYNHYGILKALGLNPSIRSFGAVLEWDGTGLP